MTNDELLSKLLDNALTESERRELDARMASSPHFAEEVREFLAVEELLVKAKPLLVSAPEHLITAVEQHAVTTIAASAAAATAAAHPHVSAFQQWITPTIAVLALGSAIVAYILWPSSTEVSPSVPVATTNAPSSAATAEPAPNQRIPSVQEYSTTQTENAVAPEPAEQHNEQRNTHGVERTQAEPQTVVHAPTQHNEQQPRRQNAQQPKQQDAQQQEQAERVPITPQQAPATQPRKFQLTTQADSPQKRELQRQIDNYAASQAEDDKIAQMTTAKKIGILYREMKDYKSSQLYLETAQGLAHTMHLEEDAAIITGELGLLAKEQGNQMQAVQLVQQCVNKLAGFQSPSLQRWKEELAALQQGE